MTDKTKFTYQVIYNKNTAQVFENCEQQRKKTLNKLIIIEVILFVILICLFLNINFFTCILMYFVIPTILVLPITEAYKFKKKIKSYLAPKLTKILNNSGFFDRIEYSGKENSIFNNKELLDSTLFGMFNQITPDDSFCGKYKGVNFKIQETTLAQSGNRYYFRTFKGIIICFDSNKDIKAKTTVTTAGDFSSNNVFPIIRLIAMLVIVGILFEVIFLVSVGILNPETLPGIWNGLLHSGYFPIIKEMGLTLSLPSLVFIVFLIFCLWLRKRNLEDINTNKKKISTESSDFIKKFRVKSEDDLESRYLITSAFMERFMNFTTSFGTKKAKCAFYNNKIMFAITSSRDLFECGSLYKSFNNPQNIEFFKDIKSVLEMAEYFKLNEKTGL